MMLLLNILKIIGIILLCILGVILLLVLLVLFVPIRYRLKVVRNARDDVMVRADAKVTWLLHLISASFCYPEAAYLKVRVLGISVFSSEKKETNGGETEQRTEQLQNTTKTEITTLRTEQQTLEETKDKKESSDEEFERKLEEKLQEEEDEPTIVEFFKKLLQKLKNIKYTILQIYDKIKRIIKNIRYYLAVIRSKCFERAFSLCKTEVISLLKSILPRKIKGNFLIGTGDPASTAQVLAIHGMLYPFIGNHIIVTPDFENTNIEGDLFVKGKITVFKVLKTAIKVYLNRDVRKVLRLLKREAA